MFLTRYTASNALSSCNVHEATTDYYYCMHMGDSTSLYYTYQCTSHQTMSMYVIKINQLGSFSFSHSWLILCIVGSCVREVAWASNDPASSVLPTVISAGRKWPPLRTFFFFTIYLIYIVLHGERWLMLSTIHTMTILWFQYSIWTDSF